LGNVAFLYYKSNLGHSEFDGFASSVFSKFDKEKPMLFQGNPKSVFESNLLNSKKKKWKMLVFPLQNDIFPVARMDGGQMALWMQKTFFVAIPLCNHLWEKLFFFIFGATWLRHR